MTKLQKLITSKVTVFFSLAGTILCSFVLLKIDQRLSSEEGLGIIYLQLAFTSFNFRAILLSWGKEGVDLYLSYQWVHFVFPVMYSMLLASTAAVMRQGGTVRSNLKLNHYFTIACVVPFFAAALDYIGNILHMVIINNELYPNVLIAAASFSASLKYIMLISVILFLLSSSLLKITAKKS